MTSLLTEVNKVSESLLSLSKKQSISDLTSNRAPFTVHSYPELSLFVDKVTRLDNLRNSKDVIKLLQDIIDQCVATILVKCWRIQSIKPRLDAMMKLAVPFLCTPLMTSILNIGESLTQSTSTLDRMKKCIVDIFTFFINTELSILNNGGEGRHEDERVQLCVALLGSKCSKYSPLAVTLREYAFTLLRGLSLHALGVAALSEDITEAISVLVHHLGMLVLGDHSPTPTPTSSRRSAAPDVFSTDVVGIQLRVLEDLTPQLADYFTWLVAHKKPFVRQCRALEVLEHVHPALRQSLQREEFFSPEDLLHKYRHKYKPHLARMPLPLQLFQREDIVQAMKDVVRENFILNSMPHHGSTIIPQMVDQLKEAFIHMDNRDTCGLLLGRRDGNPPPWGRPSHVSDPPPPQKQRQSAGDDVAEGETVDCHCSATAGRPQHVCSSSPVDLSSSVLDQQDIDNMHNKGVHPFTEFVDLMSRFLLIASSRTLASGDAFFILNDLFGGDGLTLSSSSSSARLDGGKDGIKVGISPLHISVECGQCYDLFSTVEISQCKDRKNLVPIISFQINVFTEFKFGEILQEFLNLSRSSKESSVEGVAGGKNHTVDTPLEEKLVIASEFQHSLFSFLFILLSTDPDKICRRSITIIPTILKR